MGARGGPGTIARRQLPRLRDGARLGQGVVSALNGGGRGDALESTTAGAGRAAAVAWAHRGSGELSDAGDRRVVAGGRREVPGRGVWRRWAVGRGRGMGRQEEMVERGDVLPVGWQAGDGGVGDRAGGGSDGR